MVFQMYSFSYVLLQKVECMHEFVNQGRSKGASVLLGIQSVEGLVDVCGQEKANEMLGDWPMREPATLDETWWRTRLQTALALRTPELIGPDTNGYRCINGEGDGWPGLVLDRYADRCVLKVYSASWLPHLQLVSKLIHEALRPVQLVFRMSRNMEADAARMGVADATVLDEHGVASALASSDSDRVVFRSREFVLRPTSFADRRPASSSINARTAAAWGSSHRVATCSMPSASREGSASTPPPRGRARCWIWICRRTLWNRENEIAR
jgi:hypothetical protein